MLFLQISVERVNRTKYKHTARKQYVFRTPHNSRMVRPLLLTLERLASALASPHDVCALVDELKKR